MAVTRPPSPNAIFTVCTEGERGLSKRLSSARVNTSFTGLPPMALEASAAATA
jgi:hypothetical protein